MRGRQGLPDIQVRRTRSLLSALMRTRTVLAPFAALTLALISTGCAESYTNRMKFLDEMSTKGIEYRGQLQQQHTAPNEAACKIGWALLKADIPQDLDGVGPSSAWQAQSEEAYVKSCMTGEALPKPDPSGISARTPVPFQSGAAAPSPS